MNETAEKTTLTAQAPWYVSGVRTRHSGMPVLQIISEPTGEVLAFVPYSDRTPKNHAECYADAHLISAAPAMLAALKAMVLNDTHTYRDCHKAALAAIAKAEASL